MIKLEIRLMLIKKLSPEISKQSLRFQPWKNIDKINLIYRKMNLKRKDSKSYENI